MAGIRCGTKVNVMSTQQTQDCTWHEVGPARLPVPDAWESARTGLGAVFVHPEDAGTFRPSLVLKVLPRSEGTSMAWLSTVALAADRELLHEPRFISDDVWETATGLGRMHLVLYRSDLEQIASQRWLVPAGASTVEATATYAVSDSDRMEPLMRSMVSEMQVDEHQPSAGTVAELPGREPKVDDDAMEAWGQPLERLRKLQWANRWPFQGPVLPRASFDFLATTATREGPLGRLEAGAFGREVEQLAGLGLMDGRARWTPLGHRVADGFRNRRFYAQTTLRFGERLSQFDLFAGQNMATALTGPSYHDLLEGAVPDPETRPHELMGLSTCIGAVAQWVGLAPAWTLGAPVVVDAEPLYGTLRSGGPTGTDGMPCPRGFERFWGRPWVEWTVGIPELERGLRFINAGEAGHFAIEDIDDYSRVRLAPAPSFSVWQELRRLFEAAVDRLPAEEGAPS